jgi:hypothetical protein
MRRGATLPAVGFGHYTADYDLGRKTLVWRCALPAAPERFPPLTRHGLRSEPMLHVAAHPRRVEVELEHHFTSGHAWLVEREAPPLVTVASAEAPELRALLGDEPIAALRACLADPSRWTPEALAGLFTPRGEGDAARPRAWDLSRSSDGKLPYTVLRVSQEGLQILLEHPAGEEVLDPLASDEVVVAAFGAEALEAARWLAARALDAAP